jgi:hypothetical protein
MLWGGLAAKACHEAIGRVRAFRQLRYVFNGVDVAFRQLRRGVVRCVMLQRGKAVMERLGLQW